MFGCDGLTEGRVLRHTAILLVFLMIAGCGAAKKPQGRVHGKITYNGAPVPAGSNVSFVPIETGVGGSAEVTADGSYQLRTATGDTIPVGIYQVAISAPAAKNFGSTPAEQMKASLEPDAAPAPSLPQKYVSPATTPENREVKEGENEFNIELTD